MQNKAKKIWSFLSTAHREVKMDRKPWRSEQKPQVLKQTFHGTKKFFQKTFRNLKSFLHGGRQNTKINTKVQDLDCFYESFSEQWEEDHSTNEEFKNKEKTFLPPKHQIKGDEECSRTSMKVADYKLEDSKKEKNFGSKREKESSLMAANGLAQKMKELEMMDVNDVDHVLDIEEVIHYYSRLTCSTYQEMVDKFFVDMYLEYNVNPPPLKSRNNSMRKLGSASVHGSMRSLGPIKI